SEPGDSMNIKSYLQIDKIVAQYTVMENESELILTVLMKTCECCSSGDILHLYTIPFDSYEFFQACTIHLPGVYSGFFAKPQLTNVYYGIPHNSRQIHILEINTEE
ncbi:hypothetical protein L9F63_027344, partial [Diploptera punctata]